MEIVDECGNKLPPPAENKRILAGVLGIFLGAFGIHKFVLGYQKNSTKLPDALVSTLINPIYNSIKKALLKERLKIYYLNRIIYS